MKSLFSVILALSSVGAFAASTGVFPKLEVSGGGGVSSVISGSTTINATGTVNYLVGSGVGVFIQPNYQFVNSNSVSSSTFSGLIGPQYNFMNSEDIRDDFYVQGGIGLALSSAANSQTSFEFGFEVGKRFQITESISWKPNLTLVALTNVGGQTVLAYGVNPITFSLLF
jgi:hypothetical protein